MFNSFLIIICIHLFSNLALDFFPRIKWPNDIYFGRDVKIGGTITTANCIGEQVYVNIGNCFYNFTYLSKHLQLYI